MQSFSANRLGGVSLLGSKYDYNQSVLGGSIHRKPREKDVGREMRKIDSKMLRAEANRIQLSQERIHGSVGKLNRAVEDAKIRKAQIATQEELDVMNKVIVKHATKYKKMEKDDKKKAEDLIYKAEDSKKKEDEKKLVLKSLR